MDISPQFVSIAIGGVSAAVVSSVFSIISGYINKRHDIRKELVKFKREKAIDLALAIRRNEEIIQKSIGDVINLVSDSKATSPGGYTLNFESLYVSDPYVSLLFPGIKEKYDDVRDAWNNLWSLYHDLLVMAAKARTDRSNGKEGTVERISQVFQKLKDSHGEMSNKSRSAADNFIVALRLEIEKL